MEKRYVALLNGFRRRRAAIVTLIAALEEYERAMNDAIAGPVRPASHHHRKAPPAARGNR